MELRLPRVNNNEIKFLFFSEETYDGQDNFCNLIIRLCGLFIGDRDAWTLVGALEMSVHELIDNLKSQKIVNNFEQNLQFMPKEVFIALMKNWMNDSVEQPPEYLSFLGQPCKSFRALPIDIPNFDGEIAFIFRVDTDVAIIYWSDFATKFVHSSKVFFSDYLEQWRKIATKLFELRVETHKKKYLNFLQNNGNEIFLETTEQSSHLIHNSLKISNSIIDFLFAESLLIPTVKLNKRGKPERVKFSDLTELGWHFKTRFLDKYLQSKTVRNGKLSLSNLRVELIASRNYFNDSIV